MLREHDVVRLTQPAVDDDGEQVDAGAEATVVSLYDNGGALLEVADGQIVAAPQSSLRVVQSA